MCEQSTGWHEPPRQASYLLRLTLPLPPGINEQYATVNGHRVSTLVARRFKQQVRASVQALERQGKITDALREHFRQSYLALFLDFYFATPLKRDLDGGLKITQDALCESLGLNDNRVVDIHLLKHIDPLHPHLYVELEAIADWRFDKEYVVLS
ncbi:RusA family crossover junction endodeoxyribonuclease [Ktedonosporobacter rubrisoli]|uniref:RusA family crossover junction endodeoxyribonuclease n=1 Tax=Ktedonosporobacter rubrisoli TaxID=2509675 RepID=A0A4P6JVQ5_KTERU|nr:RusA family crossover junction endodeoxyribonuclease [Ktedonosporobacter rubrisoli]QBD79747.1 RusA family crossover junction endodeoxyribonuclease [Ktedonosporobacter rubrisoli]